MSHYTELSQAFGALLAQEGSDYTAKVLLRELVQLVDQLPKTKQRAFLDRTHSIIGAKVKVPRVNVLTGKTVLVPWDQLGGPCDPSTERYHSM